MATYQVRHLHCIPCDTPVRVRNLMVGPIEVLEPCPHCDGELVSIGKLDLTPKPEVGTSNRFPEVAVHPYDRDFFRRPW